MTEITARTPWEGSMGGIPMHLDYFDGSMFEAVERIAMKYPRNVAQGAGPGRLGSDLSHIRPPYSWAAPAAQDAPAGV